MERNRNWPVWIAVALSAIALMVALGGRFDRNDRYAYSQAAPAAPAGPQSSGDGRFERGPAGIPPMMREQMDRQMRGGEGFGHGREGFGAGREGFGPGMEHGFGRHGFGPLGMLFGLIGGLMKLAALGLFAWLLLTIFQQRRQPPLAPTTPAGHDPRVE